MVLCFFLVKVGLVLDITKLKDEVDYLTKNVQLRKEMISLHKDEGFLGISRRESLDDDIYFKSEKLSLLLKWCKMICAHYDVKVCLHCKMICAHYDVKVCLLM